MTESQPTGGKTLQEEIAEEKQRLMAGGMSELVASIRAGSIVGARHARSELERKEAMVTHCNEA